MAHGLIYQGEFNSQAWNGYRLEILRKDYTGPFYTLPMAAVPIIQNWGPDEVKPAIKGSALTINYINTGSNPIENFYSNNDDEFLVKFFQDAQLLFIGYLVQDDIREPMLDPLHEVQLSANDNLGLLKDIALDKNPLTSYVPATAQGDFISITVPQEHWIYIRNSVFQPQLFTPFRISGHSAATMNNLFNPIVINTLSPGNYNVRTNTFTGDTTTDPVNINGVGGTFDFQGKASLLNLIALCLQNTGLQLHTYVYENIFENAHLTDRSPLAQTYVDLSSFASGDTYLNCYEVLSRICKRFGLTLFQSLGRWNIIRWDELRTDPAIPGFIYDENFVLQGTTTLDADMVFGFEEDTYPETGLMKSALRPFEYVKETFNYNNPKYLIKNFDMQKVGALVRTYDDGVFKYDEYLAVGFENGDIPPHGELLIVVKTELATQNEIERYLVVKWQQGFNPRAARSPGIDVKSGDRGKLSMRMRLNFSQSMPHITLFSFRLTDGVSIRYIRNNPSSGAIEWHPTIGYELTTAPNTPATEWQSLDVDFPPFPFDGILHIHYPLATNAGPNRPIGTWFKDIRFDITSYISNSTKIIGHTHKDIQDVLIKNNQDEEIYIDDSPRNTIQGTLFRNLMLGLTQQRTHGWHRLNVNEILTLGNIITRDQLQWRSVSRTRLDGSFRGLKQSGEHLSMLNHFAYTQLPGLNFLFGNLQLDYRNDRLTCSATELFKDGEPDVTEEYSFNYLYDNK